MSRTEYNRFFTNSPPTKIVIGNVQYVHDPNMFGQVASGRLRAGNELVSMEWNGETDFKVRNQDADRIVESTVSAEQEGSGPVAVLYDQSVFGQMTALIPLNGFSRALKKLDGE